MTDTTFDELETPPAPPEAPESETPNTETGETEAEGAGGSGRPRPQETIDRDAAVLKIMTDSDTRLTKEQLVEKSGLPGNQVYLSLYRLGKGLVNKGEEPKVVRTGRNWGVVGKEYPEPVAEAPATETPADETTSQE